MVSSADALRAGFAAATDLVAQARADADGIVTEAERRADLLLMDAEREAAAKRNEAELYLQKARVVLQMAQARAAQRPAVVDVADPAPSEQVLVDTVDDAVASRTLPGELDRLLAAAVSAAVTSSLPRSDTELDRS